MSDALRDKKPATQWNPNPLLSRGAGRVPSYSRMPWDQATTRGFNQWEQLQVANSSASANAHPLDDWADPKNKSDTEPDALEAGTPEHVAQAPDHIDTSANSESSGQSSKPASDSHAPSENGAAETATPVSVNDAVAPQQLKMAQQQGYVQGLKDGMVRALADLEAERQQDKAAIDALLRQLHDLLNNSDKLFEPLKRLSLHIAEQWVRGELSVSSHVIDRLLQEALSQLGKVDAVVVASLNPDDIKRLQCVNLASHPNIQLEPDENLRPGSVRIRANDTEIQDLIEHRVENMARKLLRQPEAWLQNSSLIHPDKAPSAEAAETPETIPAWARPATEVHEVEVKEIVEEVQATAVQAENAIPRISADGLVTDKPDGETKKPEVPGDAS